MEIFLECDWYLSAGTAFFLKDDSGFLMAIVPLENNKKVNFPPWYHFGYCVENVAKVKSMFEKMNSAGVVFARGYEEFGEDAANFYCWSPGPFKLEVIWNKEDEV